MLSYRDARIYGFYGWLCSCWLHRIQLEVFLKFQTILTYFQEKEINTQINNNNTKWKICYLCLVMTLSCLLGMTNQQVLQQLERGFRMEKPHNCPDSLYTIMLDTWNKDPIKRPTFEFLESFLDDYFVATEPNYKEPE